MAETTLRLPHLELAGLRMMVGMRLYPQRDAVRRALGQLERIFGQAGLVGAEHALDRLPPASRVLAPIGVRSREGETALVVSPRPFAPSAEGLVYVDDRLHLDPELLRVLDRLQEALYSRFIHSTFGGPACVSQS